MITHPLLLALCLVAVVAGVYWVRRWTPFQRVYHWLPLPFWCYFIPMCGATVGLFPLKSPLYSLSSRFLLPFCLSLLLINVDLPAVARLGRRSFWVMLISLGSIMVGGILSFIVFRSYLPPESWRIVGSLSASWMGGSANMLALKESLSVQDSLFASAVVVDTIMAYGWMAGLIFLAGFQGRIDQWNKVPDAGDIETLATHPVSTHLDKMTRSSSAQQLRPFGVAVALALSAIFLGDRLPVLGSVISHTTWTVLLVTSLSLLFSLTGWFAAVHDLTEKWGIIILYILLASIGARARLTAIFDAPQFLLMGILWFGIHGMILFGVGRVMKVPIGLLASASQASVGGPVSGPLVAAVYRPSLATVGLLMAVLGNVLGTYLGLIVARICEMVE